MTDQLKSRTQKWMRSARKKIAPMRVRLRQKFNLNRCVIVASNGRSGSTMTYTALLESLESIDPKQAAKATFAARMDGVQFEAPFLYKTHDFPGPLSNWPNETRVIFCFGPTKDSTFSVYSAKERYGEDWIDQHFYHLHATGTYDELFDRDVLQQARQIREWVTFDDIPVLCVHYDALWDHQKTISRFTGWKFTPPERRERAPKEIPEKLVKAASKVYDPIDEVIAELPKCFIASPRYSKIVDKLPLAG